MVREGARAVQGFVWLVRQRPGAGPSGPVGHPFDGVGTTYRPPCWPLGRGDVGVRNRRAGPAYLVVAPALTSGPPAVGRDWEVEPADLDGFRSEDGRVRLVGLEPHATQWGAVAECEFAVDLAGDDGPRDGSSLRQGTDSRAGGPSEVPGRWAS
jgi:hypothetical protein